MQREGTVTVATPTKGKTSAKAKPKAGAGKSGSATKARKDTAKPVPRGAEALSREASKNPEGRPLSGRDPRFHSPETIETAPVPTPWFKRMVVLAPLGLVLMMALYVGFWLLTARTASGGLAGWIADRRAEGFTITHQGIDTGGFPLQVTVRIARPAVTAPADLMPWSWQGPDLVARVNPFAASHVTLEAAGTHRLTLPLGPGGRPAPMTATADRLTSQMVFGEGADITKARILLDGLSLVGPPVGPLEVRHLEADMLDGPLYGSAPPDSVFWSLILSADGVSPPPAYRLGLSPEMERLSLSLRRFGALPGGALEPALGAWQEEGGKVTIDALSLRWPPLALDARGSLELDKNLQPQGSVTAQTTGVFYVIEGLARSGWARSADASMARMMLSGSVKNGGEIAVPISVRDRVLYAGPSRLLGLPTINWGPKGARARNRVGPGFDIDREGNVVRPEDDAPPGPITLPSR